MEKENQVYTKTQEDRHYLFLNPYLEHAFTRCPKCTKNTKIRKYCFVIHIEPHHFIVLNKSCRYCLDCDLIIVKKDDLEGLLCATCEQNCPDIIGNKYFLFGTMERGDWKRAQQTNSFDSKKLIEQTYPFKDLWHFDVESAKWVQTSKK